MCGSVGTERPLFTFDATLCWFLGKVFVLYVQFSSFGKFPWLDLFFVMPLEHVSRPLLFRAQGRVWVCNPFSHKGEFKSELKHIPVHCFKHQNTSGFN